MLQRILSRRHRVLAVPLLVALAAFALPVAAAEVPAPAASGVSSPGGAAAQLEQERQQAAHQLQQAQQNAAAEDTALSQAKSALTATQGRLARLRTRVDQLDHDIARADAEIIGLHRQANQDRASLGAFIRGAYEGSPNSTLTQALAADTVAAAVQQALAVHTVTDAIQALVERITAAQARAQSLLADVVARRQVLATDEEQTRSLLVLVGVEQSQVEEADYAAHRAVASSRATLTDALRAQRAYLSAQAALLAERSRRDLVFPPVPGVSFGVDTDLTQASGETAERLDLFLRGTALHNLGAPLVAAETNYHVSARYLLAHAIEESAFGTSRIAQDKHNLYGYGANDTNPYQNANGFATFAACIDFVAQRVVQDYLSPTGQYYHGPTLRGMNVNYATDPLWAGNIARIGATFA